MKNPLNEYFDKVIVIASKEHRPDRYALITEELARYGVEYQIFNAHWRPISHLGTESGNMGCTSSHRSVLGAICLAEWPRTLILEDDCTFVDSQWPEMFSAMIGEVPTNWKFLFLGASFAEDPKRRVSGSVIETNGLMTTSSYGITLETARKVAPYVGGDTGIDALYHGFQREGGCFLLDPRLAVQRAGLSNIQGIVIDPSQSMLDTAHLTRLDARGGDDCI